MLLDQVTSDREAEPKAAVLTCRAAVGLPEALEHVRQELRRDPGTGVLHLDADLAVLRRAAAT